MTESGSDTLPAVAPERCPLCAQPNLCTMASASATTDNNSGSERTIEGCWCLNEKIDSAVLAQVPEEKRRKACICQACAQKYNAQFYALGD